MGFVTDTHMSRFIPPNLFHTAGATWTNVAGQVTSTVVRHLAAADQTVIVNVPVVIPSNSVALKGSKLVSIEVDYEILVAACDAFTAVLNKVTRGADTAVAVVSAPAFTQAPTAANSKTVDQHKLVVTLTTPAYIDNDEYYLLELTVDQALTTQVDFLGAVVNYELRI